jgi:hypothetical protein
MSSEDINTFYALFEIHAEEDKKQRENWEKKYKEERAKIKR